MRPMQRYISTTLIGLSMFFSLSPSLHAHLMVAQHGTLNFLDHDIFMVLSLPISAFDDIDDDENGEISMIEFNNHRASISKRVKQNIILSNAENKFPLQGLRLSPVISHASIDEPITQLIVMGKYTLIEQNSKLNFEVKLFGEKAEEQTLEITATRKSTNQKNIFDLSSTDTSTVVFK